MDLSPTTFGVNLPPNPISSQINLGSLDENENSKVNTIKIL